jgi:hypothetical protein
MRVFGSWRRILFDAIFIAVFVLVAWFFLIRMPGKNIVGATPLLPEEITLRDELAADVHTLAAEIGERNMSNYPRLNAAAEFIETSFARVGLHTRRDSYEIDGLPCHNIEAEIPGSSSIVIVGAHYDSAFGAPGANDNGSGVAGMLALARRFATTAQSKRCTLRFVAFVNEEPPYFQTSRMGSFVYASRCRARHDPIEAMISLETIGCFSNAPHSQRYPSPGLGLFYPTTGNFIGFVGNLRSRQLVRRTMSIFRAQGKLPSEGACLPAIIPGVSWSDQWAFWRNGYSAIMLTDTALFRYRHYHQPTDTPDKLDYDRFALVVSGMEQVIVDLVSGPRY